MKSLSLSISVPFRYGSIWLSISCVIVAIAIIGICVSCSSHVKKKRQQAKQEEHQPQQQQEPNEANLRLLEMNQPQVAHQWVSDIGVEQTKQMQIQFQNVCRSVGCIIIAACLPLEPFFASLSLSLSFFFLQLATWYNSMKNNASFFSLNFLLVYFFFFIRIFITFLILPSFSLFDSSM